MEGLNVTITSDDILCIGPDIKLKLRARKDGAHIPAARVNIVAPKDVRIWREQDEQAPVADGSDKE